MDEYEIHVLDHFSDFEEGCEYCEIKRKYGLFWGNKYFTHQELEQYRKELGNDGIDAEASLK